ncbi:BTAD domain-containing putative transcriptional regulator [Streptomyces sp. NPDC048566]|uniref:BTAD domain-containing putative transcriptional regulator n=1 Tax=Streptomyces sp. NPDC048566 TaxID=3365569 RepID=UPI00371D5A87
MSVLTRRSDTGDAAPADAPTAGPAPSQTPAAPPTIRSFRLLGPVAVDDTAGGTTVPNGPKQRALLATLVLHADQLLSVERLVEELWGTTPPANAANALQAHVTRLRRLLPSPGRRWISTLPSGYLLAPGPASTDVALFTRLSVQGRAALPHDPGRAARVLRGALALWRGPALQDSRLGPLCTAEAERLEELRLTTLECLYEASLQCGREAEITAGLERLSTDHPLRERFYDLLMVALYRGGRQAEALGVYERARRHLVTSLGVEPGPALRTRLDAILNHSPALTPARRGGSPLSAPSDATASAREAVIAGPRARPAAPTEAGTELPPAGAGGRPDHKVPGAADTTGTADGPAPCHPATARRDGITRRGLPVDDGGAPRTAPVASAPQAADTAELARELARLRGRVDQLERRQRDVPDRTRRERSA